MDNNCYFKVMLKWQKFLKPGSWKSLENSFKEQSWHPTLRTWHAWSSTLPSFISLQNCDGNPLKDWSSHGPTVGEDTLQPSPVAQTAQRPAPDVLAATNLLDPKRKCLLGKFYFFNFTQAFILSIKIFYMRHLYNSIQNDSMSNFSVKASSQKEMLSWQYLYHSRSWGETWRHFDSQWRKQTDSTGRELHSS